ncbi:polyunsaturated fatty acid lipoxygenase ALOX15B-like isoform X2 [Homarus americanus]|uniref:Allene oxide synthase-lipoxygenase protein-like n=1 Tax=Homarus americanus TaxID=6706 RepID=A0A8J5JJR9_HOMAM|nr:polyunsaturated fatty acid lipoxygenase ALOX15B-like isoform X2 [Homarus americanus]KAG7158596.1 Allene oxide synthase-lipoxygenase protein-like [Homarus americanus]
MDEVSNLLFRYQDYISNMLGFIDTRYRVHVITGDRRGAGTDANVSVVLHDIHGRTSLPISCNKTFSNDNERGSTTTVDVKVDCGLQGPIVRIEVWRDNFADITIFGRITEYLFGHRSKRGSAEWFLDRIEVEEVLNKSNYTEKCLTNNVNSQAEEAYKTVHKSASGGRVWVFPLQRWVSAERKYILELHDCFLPQMDPNQQAREIDIQQKRKDYRYEQKVEHGPAQIENLPSDEKFSEEYYWTFATDKLNLLAQTKFIEWTTSKWNTLDDLKRVYRQSLGEPTCIGVWKEDWWFGLQRLQGVNPNVIRLCKKIPDNFAVTEETVKGFLGEMSLAEALEKNKMFICDLEITDGLVCKEGNYGLASPLALFHLNSENSLLPVAIQLKQKRGPDNPVYTPNDPPNTWLVAKMFYNNVEAQHHQALTHLGYTHLLMEGVVICTHRNLSPSHPLFKLMAPHFLFLLAINTRGLEKLVAPGGWVDNCMTQGVTGIFNLMKRGFDRWRFDREGQVEKELEARGVLDKTILPYYPYRDDAIPLYNVIKKYVTTVVKHHYDTPEKISGDWELRWWREELVKSRDENGVGLQNVPGTADGFTTVEEVIDVVTVIISICSLGHAAANFQQYEQYGFVPNYPGILMLDIPKEKKNYTEEEIMAMLPDKRMTLDIMVITKLLSSRGTKSLGDFEMQYLYDPVGVQAAEEFQKDLKRLSYEMKGRNIDRPWKFDWLDPEIVPNSISV